jgi:hypothetical protein
MERHVPPKRQLTFNELHSVISQNMQVFITINVRAYTLYPSSTETDWLLFQYIPLLSLHIATHLGSSSGDVGTLTVILNNKLQSTSKSEFHQNYTH